MRLLTAAVIALGLAWSAFWFFGAAQEKAALAAWFDARDGAEAAGVTTRGFPNRFDSQIDAPRIAAGSVAWSAPFLQAMRFSYASDHYVLAFAHDQRLMLPDETLTLTTTKGLASATFDGGALQEARFTFEAPALASGAGWALQADRLVFAVRRSPDGMAFGLDAPGLTLDAARTDLHVEGRVTLHDGLPAGRLAVTATDTAPLAAIAGALGLASRAPETVTLESGTLYLDGTPIGPVPRFP